MNWDPKDIPPPAGLRLDARALFWLLLRGIPLAVLVLGGLLIHLVLRLIERAFRDQQRKVSGAFVTLVCALACRIIGLKLSTRGQMLHGEGVIVSNHASWLDIFVLNARGAVFFVAKAEVAGWPLIGWLARATGTLFIRRERKDAKVQTELLASRLAQGHRLAFFPEGTSTDGRRVLPFRSSLFQAVLANSDATPRHVQPVTLIYHAPKGQEDRFYGWWGDMDFAPHLAKVLAHHRQGSVEIVFHPAITLAATDSRKDLAQRCESTIRAALFDRLGDQV